MKHRDPIALLRSYLCLRSRSFRDSRSFHRPFHPFTVLWTGKPTALLVALSSSLFPPLSTSGASPLVWLERSESFIVYLSLSLALARALERVYARIRFQSLKAGRVDARTEDNADATGKVARAAQWWHGGGDSIADSRQAAALHSLSLGHDGG